MAEVIKDDEGNEFEVSEIAELLLDPLIERDKVGKFIVGNFSSMESLVFPKSKQVRPRLSDWVHLSFMNIMLGSLYLLSPFFIRSGYNLGKFIGYFTVQQLVLKNPTSRALSLLRQAGITWEILENKKVQNFLKDGWAESGGGLIDFTDIDPAKNKIVISLQEGASSVISGMKDPYCHFELGILCGQMEYLLGGRWDGIETECVAKGADCCRFELTRDGDWESTLLPLISQHEATVILDKYLEIALSIEKDFKRPHTQNFQHISVLQALNYIILSRSSGHGVLLKYAGKTVGKRIAAEKKLHSIEAVFKYLSALFSDLKFGIMEVEYPAGHIQVSLKESVFSAGAKNLKAKLCVYLCGIIEGCLDTATGESWLVEEEKCVASGDPVCVFGCISRKTAVMQVLLLK